MSFSFVISGLRRYGLALGLVVLAIGARRILDPVLGNTMPFIFLFPAVMLAAWYGGAGPAVAAIVLGSLTAGIFLLEPRGSLDILRLEDRVGLALFCFVGLVLVWVGRSLRQARFRAEVVAAALRRQKDALERELGRANDITGRKRAEDALRESQWRLSEIIGFLPDATFVVDREGKVIAWNRAVEKMTGVKAEDMLGKGDYEYALPFYQIKRPILIDLVFLSDERIEKEYDYVVREGDALLAEMNATLNGEPRFLWGKAVPLYDGQGTIVAAIEAIRDITERKRAEESLRESEERFHSLFDRAPMAYQSLDEEGRFIEVNQAWLETFGYHREEVVGQWFGGFLATEFVDVFREQFPLFKTAEKIHSEFQILHKNGTRRFIAFEGQIGYKPDGTFKQTHCILSDITERKRIEEFQAFLAQTSSGTTSETFFQALARYLAKSLGMDFVCIDRLEGDRLHARTVAVWCDGRFENNVTYALKDTPCADVVGKAVCCFPANVRISSRTIRFSRICGRRVMSA